VVRAPDAVAFALALLWHLRQTLVAAVGALSAIRAQIKTLEDQIATQLAAHPDGHIFTSLPRAGTVRAARLLAEIGDARGRYPTPELLVCLAGAAPSTRQSGKVKVVSFRWAVDKQLRGAVTDFVGDSHTANAWAADLYRRARDRGHDHPHAVRILARAWLHVIWRCWQDNEPYNPDNHRALQRILTPAAGHRATHAADSERSRCSSLVRARHAAPGKPELTFLARGGGSS
jgi:transposase